jgi:hypothetical protein
MARRDGMPWRATLLALLLGSVACQSEEQSVREPVSAPFDVGAIIRQVHFAFRQEAGAWSGGHSTYAVRASAEGLTLTPFHHLGAAVEPLRASAPETAKVVKGAPLMLGAAQLERGGSALERTKALGRVERDGHLALARAEAITEHLRNTEDGVEQSWTFDRAPSGEGELRVRIPAEGLAFTGMTEGGLHFADPRTGLGFRYGHATWVEASGRKTPLQAEYIPGHILVRVPAELLAASAYPAILDPIISPEQTMDTPVLAPASGSQYNPATASNGTHYLVVWQDTRAGSNPVIYGTRVTSAGDVVDTTGLRIATDSLRQYLPAVDSNGTDWFVVWEDDRNGAGSRDIYGARVSAAGVVLDSASLALVVWAEIIGTSPGDIRGARISGAGHVLDLSSLLLSTAAGDQRSPAVASHGTDYLAAWQEARNGSSDIYGARVANTGEVLDPSGLALSMDHNTEQAPAVESNGTDYLVVWQDWRDIASPDIYGVRVSGAGEVLDPAGLVIHASAHGLFAPALASNGTGWFVVWEKNWNGQRLHGTRVANTGEVMDPAGIPICTTAADQRSPAVASNGVDYFVTWNDYRSGASPDIYGARVLASGTVVDTAGFALGTAAVSESTPAVASNGTDYLAVWKRDTGLTTDIYATRVTSAGVVVDPAGLALSTAAGGQYAPGVASDGTSYLVVWEDARVPNDRDVYGTRVTGAGEVVDPAGLLISPGADEQRAPAVAFDGANYLVAWEHFVRASGSLDLRGARVTSAGTLLEPEGFTLSAEAASESAVSVASAEGQRSFVVYQQALGSPQRVAGRFISFTTLITLPGCPGSERAETSVLRPARAAPRGSPGATL